MFFKAMPRISYKANEKTILTKDIFRRVGLDRRINSKLAVNAYYVKDGETPEMLANNFYSTPKYHWVILTVNDIVNVNEEWPKNQSLLFEYTEAKYGQGNALKDHHYKLAYRYALADDSTILVQYDAEKLAAGDIQAVAVDPSEPPIIVDYDVAAIAAGTIVAVSNLDFEISENEKKRQIYLLKPEFLAQFVTSYKSLMAK